MEGKKKVGMKEGLFPDVVVPWKCFVFVFVCLFREARNILRQRSQGEERKREREAG